MGELVNGVNWIAVFVGFVMSLENDNLLTGQILS